jgi:hypothetical protein
LRIQPLGNGAHFGTRLTQGNAGFEPGNGVNTGVPGAVIRQFARPGRHGNDEIRRLLQQLEPLRKHSDYDVRLAIEDNGLPNNTLRAAKPALPQPITQQRHGRRCRLVVNGTDRPAGNRVDTKHVQQVSADHLAGNLLRLASPGQRHRHDTSGSELFERRALRLPVLIVQPRGGEHGKVRCPLRDDHQAIGVRERKRTQ